VGHGARRIDKGIGLGLGKWGSVSPIAWAHKRHLAVRLLPLLLLHIFCIFMNWTGGKRTSVKAKLDLQKQRDFFNRQRLRRYHQFSAPSVTSLHRSASTNPTHPKRTASDRIRERLSFFGSSTPFQPTTRHDHQENPEPQTLRDIVNEFTHHHRKRGRREDLHHDDDDGDANRRRHRSDIDTFNNELGSLTSGEIKKSESGSGNQAVEKIRADKDIGRSMDVVMLERDVPVCLAESPRPVRLVDAASRKQRLLEQPDWASLGSCADETYHKSRQRLHDSVRLPPLPKQGPTSRKILLNPYEDSDDERLGKQIDKLTNLRLSDAVDNRTSRRRSLVESVDDEEEGRVALVEHSLQFRPSLVTSDCALHRTDLDTHERPASPTSLTYLSHPAQSVSAASLQWQRFLDVQTSQETHDENEGRDDTEYVSLANVGGEIAAKRCSMYGRHPISERHSVSERRSPSERHSLSMTSSCDDSARSMTTGIIGSPTPQTVGSSTVAWNQFILGNENVEVEGNGEDDEADISTGTIASGWRDRLVESSTTARASSSIHTPITPTKVTTGRMTTILPAVVCAGMPEWSELFLGRNLGPRRTEKASEDDDGEDEDLCAGNDRWSLSPQLSPLRGGRGGSGEQGVVRSPMAIATPCIGGVVGDVASLEVGMDEDGASDDDGLGSETGMRSKRSMVGWVRNCTAYEEHDKEIHDKIGMMAQNEQQRMKTNVRQCGGDGDLEITTTVWEEGMRGNGVDMLTHDGSPRIPIPVPHVLHDPPWGVEELPECAHDRLSAITKEAADGSPYWLEVDGYTEYAGTEDARRELDGWSMVTIVAPWESQDPPPSRKEVEEQMESAGNEAVQRESDGLLTLTVSVAQQPQPQLYRIEFDERLTCERPGRDDTSAITREAHVVLVDRAESKAGEAVVSVPCDNRSTIGQEQETHDSSTSTGDQPIGGHMEHETAGEMEATEPTAGDEVGAQPATSELLEVDEVAPAASSSLSPSDDAVLLIHTRQAAEVVRSGAGDRKAVGGV
ncbi:hypothetical protein BC936DRAFT_144010, partial [Jimgerdemannia flammicorona]